MKEWRKERIEETGVTDWCQEKRKWLKIIVIEQCQKQ